MLSLHPLNLLLAYLVRLVLPEFVCVRLLVLRGKLPTLLAKTKTPFSSLSLHHFCSLGSELLPRFRLVGLSSHSDNDTAVPSVLIENLSLLSLFLLEMVGVAGVKVVI